MLHLSGTFFLTGVIRVQWVISIQPYNYLRAKLCYFFSYVALPPPFYFLFARNMFKVNFSDFRGVFKIYVMCNVWFMWHWNSGEFAKVSLTREASSIKHGMVSLLYHLVAVWHKQVSGPLWASDTSSINWKHQFLHQKVVEMITLGYY